MSDLMSIGRTGLDASRKSIETTSHNIANVNSEGYSRQRVDQVSNRPVSKSGLIVGTGAQIRGINRVEDKQLETRITETISDHHYFKEKYSKLDQVQELFNEIDSEGLNLVLNKFFNSFRQLANQPENETMRSIVRDNARIAVTDFKKIAERLNDVSKNIDNHIEQSVQTINSITSEIAKINTRIAKLEAAGEETGDLRDRRDVAVRDLSEQIKVKTYVDNRGNYVVNSDGLGSLVTAGRTIELMSKGVTKDQSTNGLAGSVDVFFKARPHRPISEKFQGGRLSSMIEMKNNIIVDLKKRMDNLAFNFVNTVNSIHQQGYIANKESSPNINGDGVNFFTALKSDHEAALNIELSEQVENDLDNICTAAKPNSPGDNSIAVKISQLQYDKTMDDNTSTFEEYFLKNVGKIGLDTGKAQIEMEQTEGILSQATAIKERITGVSLDEEAANLVKYQHTYQASAKVIQAAEEMFRTLISIGS